MVFLCYFHEEVLHFLEFLRVFCREIVRFTEIFVHIIQFPYIIFQWWILCCQPGDGMACASYPAIMVNGTVTKHLKVLGRMPVFGFGIVKSVNHRRPIERKLFGAIHHLWKRQADCFQYSRCNIYHVTELRADLTFSFDSFGPMHYHTVPGAAPMGSNLLGPLKRSIEGMRPSNGIVRESIWTSPVIQVIHHLRSIPNDAIQSHHLIVRPFRSAFGTRSVITYNVN